ncbi:MAG: hypothetical protein IIX93_11240 [Clostridia bacterium]|nr:hypothetical protein [Clostridia bacterium]
MNEQTAQKIRLIINGAIHCYEGECIDIPDILKAENRPDIRDAYDAIGTALYWIKEEMEGRKAVSFVHQQ